MMRHVVNSVAATFLFTCLFLGAQAQSSIDLGSVIGVSGTNAASVAGVGNPVNFTGNAINVGATTLTASGSSGGPSLFNFNTGFSDTLDRATGSTAGAPNVFVDLKYDSATTSPLVLDMNNDGSFSGENSLAGFGMHGDTFITFDLAVIRTNNSLTAGTAFALTGYAGIANTTLAQTSAAIIVDGAQLAVFDWSAGAGNTFSTFNLSLSGSARYLTFIGLSGLDNNNFFAHVGFANVQLQAVPEPSVVLLLATGLTLGGLIRGRRART